MNTLKSDGSDKHTGTTAEPSRQTSPDKTTDNVWVRFLYMVLFAIIFSVVETIVYLTAIAALIFLVFSRSVPSVVVDFGRSLAKYAGQIIRYLTFDTETHPFPFSSWPVDQVAEASDDTESTTHKA